MSLAGRLSSSDRMRSGRRRVAEETEFAALPADLMLEIDASREVPKRKHGP